jgi:hypothetical protein
MKILAIEKEMSGLSAKDFQPHLEAESARVWALYQAGIIREMYFRDDVTEAVLMLECEGAEEAREVLATLPLVREGLITFDVIPLRPYPSFSRLFTRDWEKSNE